GKANSRQIASPAPGAYPSRPAGGGSPGASLSPSRASWRRGAFPCASGDAVSKRREDRMAPREVELDLRGVDLHRRGRRVRPRLTNACLGEDPSSGRGWDRTSDLPPVKRT